MSDNEFIDVEGALSLLGVSRPTLYRWLRDGTLRGSRVGRQWRFSRQELTAFVRGGVEQEASPLERDLREVIAFFQQRAAQRRPPR